MPHRSVASVSASPTVTRMDDVRAWLRGVPPPASPRAVAWGQLQPLVVPHCGQQWHEPARTIDTPHW